MCTCKLYTKVAVVTSTGYNYRQWDFILGPFMLQSGVLSPEHLVRTMCGLSWSILIQHRYQPLTSLHTDTS